VRPFGGAKGDLAALKSQLNDALAEKRSADAAAAAADAAKSNIDGADRVSWERACDAVTETRREAERSAHLVTATRRKCRELAKAIATEAEAAVAAEAAKVDRELAEIERRLASLRERREAIGERLEDAAEQTRAAGSEFLEGDERRAYQDTQRQRREKLHWHARHPGQDDALSRHDRAEMLEIRAAGAAAAAAANKAAELAAEARGELVVRSDGSFVEGVSLGRT